MPFKLFSCCFLVKGHERSIICDIQRQSYSFIPNDLYNLLIDYNGKTIDFIKSEFKNRYDTIIDEYFHFLESNEYIFYHEEPNLFPDISLEWKSPYKVTNSIIDFRKNNNIDFEYIFKQLQNLGCKYIQLRFYYSPKISLLIEVLSITKRNNRVLNSLELILEYDEKLSVENLVTLALSYPFISIIYLFGYHETRIEKQLNWKGAIVYSIDKVLSDKHCGIITNNNFSIDLESFTESQKHNTCLNRKISVDVNGEIKNCPSMSKSYGNIKDTTLEEAINKPGFKDLWFVHKDQIDVCKDCEFRHICTDCRAFIQDPTNIYSKPAKCSYDPYTATWGDEGAFMAFNLIGFTKSAVFTQSEGNAATLFWQADCRTNQEGMGSFKCQTGTQKGKFIIEIEGIENNKIKRIWRELIVE